MGSLDVEWLGVLHDRIHSRGSLNRVMELSFR